MRLSESDELLARDRISAAIIEHDMDVVFNYSDRIVAMHEGTILADGPPEEIRRHPAVRANLLGAEGLS